MSGPIRLKNNLCSDAATMLANATYTYYTTTSFEVHEHIAVV